MNDFLLDANGDLAIVDGDLVVGPSDGQNIVDIINSFAGAWKQWPQVGVGILQYVQSGEGANALQQAIKQQLQADGFNVSGVTVAYTPQGLKVTLGATANPVVRITN